MGATATEKVNSTARLTALRELMAKEEYNIDAYVVPSEDQHSSEYLAECDARRGFISGFDGSAGCAIVTSKEALMFTDGRYFLQAREQMDDNWTLMKQGLPNVPTWQEYLSQKLAQNSRVGIDPTLISVSDAKALKESLTPRGSTLVPVLKNLVDEVWGAARPSRPHNPVFPLDIRYAGVSSQDKMKELRKTLQEKKTSGMVISMLDEVAWLFNLRGSDIEYNPVFFAYAMVTQSEATLYVNEKQIDDTVRAHLGSEVTIKSYEAVWEDFKQLGNSLESNKDQILLGTKTSFAIAHTIGEEKVLITRSPVNDAKAIKNETEKEGFRQCHIRDGVALARYFAWLEETLNNNEEISESQAASQLEKYRSELDLFKGLSFTTISSTGPNCAIIHYSPDPVNSAIILKKQMYLCDSGGQFWDGTTDVTRTWHFGEPTDEERRAFTRVLQGHIAIDTAIFPQGTSGYILDAFARRALWQDGLDYRHGTGHGVGHFLNVHEGPQGIGTRIVYNDTHLKAGMTLSNEPGYYADGKYGIRIENIVLVRSVETPNNFGGTGYLGFEHLTLCPIHTKLVDADLLTPNEKRWLNEYHREVREKIAPFLKNDERAQKWLKRETQSL